MNVANLYREAIGRLARKPSVAVCGSILIVFILASILVPIVSPYEKNGQRLSDQNQSPSLGHPFGTDTKGRDIMTRVLWGGRITFTIGIAAVIISTTIGVMYGAVAGYVGGTIDLIMMRIVDILYGLPSIAYIILVIYVFDGYGERLPFFGDHPLEWNILLMTVALGSISWLTLSRIVRGQVLSLKEREFVEAAKAMGSGTFRIIFRHILPNVMGPIIVYTTLAIPSVILAESLISFLGLGIKPPEPSWGILISDGSQALIPGTVYWWMLLFPALFLGITILCLNVIGDALRDALDVKTRTGETR